MTRKLIPPDITHDLKYAIKRAVSDALADPRTKASVLHCAGRKRTLKLIAELRCRVNEALLEICSDFNTQNTPVGGLFDELLCLVFSFLPTTDLILATHVCTKWRSVALANPKLWCRIDYEPDYHNDDCDCNRTYQLGYGEGCHYEDDVVGSANLQRVLDLLPRGGRTLPISLNVHIPEALDTTYGDLRRLARALQFYAPRLVTLDFRVDNVDGPAHFLKHFDCLPALRTLSVQWIWSFRSGSSADGGAQFLFRPLGLPTLETLEVAIKPGHGKEKRMVPETLPSLTSLDFRFVNTNDILAYLTIAPRLRKLRLRCPDKLHVEPDEACERVRAHMPAGDVAIVDIIPAILAMFNCAAHASVLLGYHKDARPNPPVEGMRILGHLGVVEELCITPLPLASGSRPAEGLVISARGPAGQVRTLTGFRKDTGGVLSDMWDNLVAPPRSLVVDTALWLIPAQMAAGVKTLTVLISPVRDLTELARALPAPFLALEEVKITAQDVPPVSSAALQCFLQFLSVPGGVLRLVLNRIKIDGDIAQLKDLVHTVVFQ